MAILIIPIVLCFPILIFIFTWLIPEIRNDRRWYRYECAYQQWEDNNREGPMPQSKDFRWKPPK